MRYKNEYLHVIKSILCECLYTVCERLSLSLCAFVCACLTYTDVVSTVVVSAAVKSHQSLGERHV